MHWKEPFVVGSDMAVKVVQGIVPKPDSNPQVNQPTHVRAVAEQAKPNAAAIQQSFSKVAASSDAVISSLKNIRASGTKEGLKDIQSAEDKAEKVSEKIRDDKEGALQAHDKLDGVTSGPVLEN